MREKEEFIRDFNEAFAKNDPDFILNNMSDTVVWDFVGEKTMKGKDEVREFLKPMNEIKTLEMELHQIISRDQSAAANGMMKIKEPSGEIKRFGFVDLYEFEGLKMPKVKKMTSYMVRMK